MTEIEQFVGRIAGFDTKPAPLQVEAFAWYLHEVGRKERFSTADIVQLFDAAHIARPNISLNLGRLCNKKPARVLKDTKGYRLSNAARNELSGRLPVHATSVKTTHLLAELLKRVTSPIQLAFLKETLVCYKHGAYRAAVIMAWNLVYSDVLDRIVTHHLAEFNKGVGTNNLKTPITRREDFENFSIKESEVIRIGRTTGVLGKETTKALEEKLGKRNTAAHPSNVVVSEATANEVIFDLVQNVLLKAVL